MFNAHFLCLFFFIYTEFGGDYCNNYIYWSIVIDTIDDRVFGANSNWVTVAMTIVNGNDNRHYSEHLLLWQLKTEFYNLMGPS